MIKFWILAGVLLLALLVSSCGGLAFTIANTPALFGDFERRADLAYGTHERQRLDVYTPKDAANRPIIVFWYGGSWEKGRKEQYRFVGAALAEAGYVAVLPDYRLYPEVRFPGFVDDGVQALAWVVSNARELGGDPARIYLAGHSAGAHEAAMVAYDAARLEKAGLKGVVRGFIGLSGPYALEPDNDTLRTIFAAPHGFGDWQPARLVKPGAPPALLLHGAADEVVLARHSQVMADSLVAAGVPVTLRLYPERGHRDTVSALAAAAPSKLPVLDEIKRFLDVPPP